MIAFKTMTKKNGLTGTLAAIEQEANGKAITINDIVRAVQKRGFGPLLIGPALIIVMPTGAIPGVPAVCALLILLVAAQLLIGANHPWLPKKIGQFSFSKEQFSQGFKRFRPYTAAIDDFFHPRFEMLTRHLAQQVIAALCILLSIFIIVLGFIPFAPWLPALAIVLFGLGLSMHDGLLTFSGLLVVLAGLSLIPFLMENLP